MTGHVNFKRNVWFSSDTHYYHGNIIKYSSRPFSSVEEMNEVMIERHNALVKPGDIWYFLGDFAFAKNRKEHDAILERLNGKKIMITGNHDRSSCYGSIQWDEVYDRVLEVEIIPGEPAWTLAHFPHLSWNRSHHGAFHLHGHTHGSLPFDLKVRRLDVGVDTHDFKPWSVDEIKEKLGAVPHPTYDHHNKEV